MRELVRTNDPVLVSFIETLLKDAGIMAMVADQNMSVMEGSIGVLPRRILVPGERYVQACQLLEDADLGGWISEGDNGW